MLFWRCLVTAALVALTTSIVLAQDARTVDVHFAPGASGATVSGTIEGDEFILYRVGAEAGQMMQVRLSPSNLATYFNVYAPGRGPGDEALANSQFTDPLNLWSGALSASGEYTISVYMMRSAARRGERSDYSIDISVTGALGDTVRGDFADGLQGGPDFFAANLSEGGSLNVRAEPSVAAAIVTRLSHGQNVKNLGCRMSEGRRWCRIATLADPGIEGWAAGDFLIEGTGAAAQTPTPAPNSDGE